MNTDPQGSVFFYGYPLDIKLYINTLSCQDQTDAAHITANTYTLFSALLNTLKKL